MSAVHEQIDKRHDFLFLFDVKDGNPNGDPDNDNLPRTDPETGEGIVTDVCLKRKIRDYVDITHGGKQRYNIYIRKGDVVALNDKHSWGYKSIGLKGAKKVKPEQQMLVEMVMRAEYYDVRTFGAVMTTNVNAGQVRGPIQLTFSRSCDPVFAHDVSITRVAVTKPEDMVIVAEEEGSEAKGKQKQTEMGRKALVPYGLYVGHGFFNPFLVERKLPADFKVPNGVDEAKIESLKEDHRFKETDLQIFWEAMQNMFDFDRSASRGWMELRGLYVFSHEKKSGNAHAHELFRKVEVKKKDGVTLPRSIDDYEVHVDKDSVPSGVTLKRLVG